MALEAIFSALKLSLWLALWSTVILMMISLPLAWWLSRSRGFLSDAVNALVALPLFLPPTVLGFYLLLFLSPDGWGGAFAGLFGLKSFAFRFEGLVLGSVIFSLPFVVQPLQANFAAIGARHLEAAASLGAFPIDQFWSIALPMAKKGLILAAILGFSHTMGEFGVVLMIGGNIPGETQLLSVAIFDAVESLAWQEAHIMSGLLLTTSFIIIFFVSRFHRIYGGHYR